ncbi:uncharacterized protein PHACADRAFT_264839 [Phanerochaete carnosa HHB-10118-sp]|uniref:Uncharacterized protein n=1 Tax=Phanerochaete carnosa (strain HHB-10118-sp) TaxID=650164 RepID=K5WJ03_PHACS|nr:uncharacterized protein PHACADRAFT_264839 [Phanerochaete carnosa HHB-10118-sp]EKM50227.1 hypothetical protein PHACADRAFT_264839 [Phanerochaete carnosa HHB-10118-sp]
MEDVVTHERARAFAHRRITRTDLKKWSGITVDGAGLLEDWQVFIGPAETSAQPLKSKRIIFMDTQDSHSFRNCASATLSSDGTLLAASFEDGDILIWRLSDSLLVQHLHHRDLSSSTPAEAAKFLVFCSRDKTLVSCSAGCETFWDIQSGHRLESPWRNSFCRPILSVVYAPNGVLSAVSHWKGTNVTLKDGRKMSSILVHGYIRKLSFSPDSLRLYIELKDSCIIFDTNTHKRIAIIQRESTRPLYCSMSYQGDRIVTASDDGKMKIWSAVTGRNLLTIKFPKILSTSVTFSPDGAEVMAACRADNTAIAYDSWTGGLRRVFQFSARAQHLLYSPNGAFVAVGTVNGDLQVFNARSGTFVAKFEGAGEGWDFKAIQFLPDSRTLLAQLSHGPLILYNIQDALRVR